jgi:hypothetical protein
MDQGLFSLAESAHLRLEAMQLFEQCLTSGDPSELIAFIERQLIQEPPRLQLLQDLSDDLQQRLLSLREYHFDVRDRVVRTLSDSYGVDITTLAPPNDLENYHHLPADDILSFVRERCTTLGDKDLILLRKLIEASLQMASQLDSDIQLTTQLHNLVSDWLGGMHATVARQHWATTAATQPKTLNH